MPDKSETRDKYIAVFSSGIGIDVLEDILRTCHFGETLDADNPQRIGEFNVGMHILHQCGIFVRDGQNNFRNVVLALLNAGHTIVPGSSQMKGDMEDG